jgi:hypothetical protein
VVLSVLAAFCSSGNNNVNKVDAFLPAQKRAATVVSPSSCWPKTTTTTTTTTTTCLFSSTKNKQQQQQQHATKNSYFASSSSAAPPASTTTTTASSTSAPTEEQKSDQAAAAAESQKKNNAVSKNSRILGSQELLMLPRQYGATSANKDKVVFPQMNHVAVALLSSTPAVETTLQRAINDVMQAHPLLQCRVDGTGEPDKRIDLMQMVRKGEPDPCTFRVDNKLNAQDVLSVIDVDVMNNKDNVLRASLDASWQRSFEQHIDNGSWCNPAVGPLWKLELHKLSSSSGSAAASAEQPCALFFAANHAISDASSFNRLLDQILYNMASIEENDKIIPPSKPQAMPMALEDSVFGLGKRWSNVGPGQVGLGTIAYVAGKAAEGLKNPVILPDAAIKNKSSDNNANAALGALSIISGKTAGGKDDESERRRSVLQFRKVDATTTSALLQKCRDQGVTMSNALTAAAALIASDLVVSDIDIDSTSSSSGSSGKERNYKVLQSLDMRRFGAQLDQGETVACMAGSHDLMLGPIADRSGQRLCQSPTLSRLDEFWKLAKKSQQQTKAFVDSDGPTHATRVFDFAMTISDLNNLVHLTSQSKDTKGRAYSAGVTNAGVYERLAGFQRQGENGRQALQLQRGRYRVQEIYSATTHVNSGCLYPLSALTVGGELQITFNPVSPIVSAQANKKLADSFVEMLEVVAGTRNVAVDEQEDSNTIVSFLKENTLPLVAAIVGTLAVASHGPAFLSFFNSLMEMKQNAAPGEFWPAFNFWLFFAGTHPILPPILWISDVLHATPGPKIAGLVPVLFVAGNLAVIAAFTLSKQVRNAVNIAAFTAFLAYIGSGLDGTAGLGDFNLALDDSYKGQIVKGCPAYSEVRQPSMDGFDLTKYQGKWYEAKFHDWTQFKEVYDTTLVIKLTDGGLGWVDDFAVKGPAPAAATKSWWASPVGNGAHYFLFGRVDPNDPPGVLKEKGFGVEFDNYIVDVKKNPVTGEYIEAIQFQCLERG